MIFKVWSCDRLRKKGICAGSLEELQEKASDKLEIDEEVRLVLNDCGTEVEDNEFLEAVAGQILIVLGPGQEWTDPKSTESSAVEAHPGPSTVDIVVNHKDGPGVATLPILEASDTCTVDGAPNDTLSVCDNAGSRITRDVPLPTFSQRVLNQLQEGQPQIVWSLMISEAANYYLGSFPKISSSTEYQLIGSKIWSKYSCIGREGTKPWSMFATNLSQRIRHIRWLEKQKTCPPKNKSAKRSIENVGEDDTSAAKKKKRVHLAETPLAARKEQTKDISEEDYESHVVELKNEWCKPNPSSSHICTILKETFKTTQAWIKALPDGRVSPILEKIPCYNSTTYVLHDFKIMIGIEAYDTILENLSTLMDAVEQMIPEEDKMPGLSRMLPILKYLEKETGYEKGKGIKTSTVITRKDDIPDSELERELSTKQHDPPRIIVFYKNDELTGIMIVADGSIIKSTSRSVAASLFGLIAVYYVFQLEYPKQFSQVLGVLQTHVVGMVPYEGKKSTKFRHFSLKLRKAMGDEQKKAAIGNEQNTTPK